ncbi:uncharacterized protein CLUP02_09192 [Colletotrichum lupini]|uniref:Uncharacterized protein n=1 Tax=Colletotrichum lupini TaxID=145971 RepID=A0A9Q8SVS3_9PEZI|nr:uncharacterized protein CLUP02_09192 [Colletotrichum lupini]UQC83696.1 hypothetical protein CLUP02_09192 [Colletotrichum lupini]
MIVRGMDDRRMAQDDDTEAQQCELEDTTTATFLSKAAVILCVPNEDHKILPVVVCDKRRVLTFRKGTDGDEIRRLGVGVIDPKVGMNPSCSTPEREHLDLTTTGKSGLQ